MKPKEFIKNVLIGEMKDIVNKHPYLAFALIAIGIEFLGKCMIIECDHWDFMRKESEKYKPFDKGMELMIKIDNRYFFVNLKDQLRNGFVHTLLPKSEVALSEVKSGDRHFDQKSYKTILVIEILYRDFVRACHMVLDYPFKENDKMNGDFLTISNPYETR